VKAVFVTHRGAVRRENQDALCVNGLTRQEDMESGEVAEVAEYPALLAVVDGMGGYRGGALAARVLAGELARADMFGGAFDPPRDEEVIRGALGRASAQMASLAGQDPGLSQMGAAVAGLILRERGATAFNCGDCRVYRVSGGETERITKDHSVVQALFENGDIDEDAMRTHPRKNIVTSAVTADASETPELYVRGLSRVESDGYFICSDGVWEAMPARALGAALSDGMSDGDLSGCADYLRKQLLSLKCGDNISFIFLKE
jgi:serine/threonine protein phosphatase PrpC